MIIGDLLDAYSSIIKLGHLKIPVYKRIFSYLYPVCIERRSSVLHPVLELYLYRNQWQLATEDAYYSDGKRYGPLLAAFKKIKPELPSVDRMLVLGTGLASAVQILEDMGFHPACTLVDIDNTVLDLAIELMPGNDHSHIDSVCMDAQMFIQENTSRYPLIVCDVFMGRNVPDFVASTLFLQKCKAGLQKGGRFILNYIEKSQSSYNEICSQMDRVFPGYTCVGLGMNKIFLASA